MNLFVPVFTSILGLAAGLVVLTVGLVVSASIFLGWWGSITQKEKQNGI